MQLPCPLALPPGTQSERKRRGAHRCGPILSAEPCNMMHLATSVPRSSSSSSEPLRSPSCSPMPSSSSAPSSSPCATPSTRVANWRLPRNVPTWSRGWLTRRTHYPNPCLHFHSNSISSQNKALLTFTLPCAAAPMSAIVPSTLGKPSSPSSLLAWGRSTFRVTTRATNHHCRRMHQRLPHLDHQPHNCH